MTPCCISSSLGWTYTSDYESEPAMSVLDPDARATNYTFAQLSANASINAIQDQLANLSTVYSAQGVYSTFKGLYQLQLFPQVAQDYVALLSVRHPNIDGTFTLTRFTISAIANPVAATDTSTTGSTTTTSSTPTSLAAALASGTASAASIVAALGPSFNPLVNPKLTFNATFPKLNAATYGGADRLVAHFSAIVSSVAALTSPQWVVAVVASPSPVVIQATVSSHISSNHKIECGFSERRNVIPTLQTLSFLALVVV